MIGGSLALLPFHWGACRDIGTLIALVAVFYFILFGVSFKKTLATGAFSVQLLSSIAIGILAIFSLLLLACLS